MLKKKERNSKFSSALPACQSMEFTAAPRDVLRCKSAENRKKQLKHMILVLITRANATLMHIQSVSKLLLNSSTTLQLNTQICFQALTGSDEVQLVNIKSES